MCLQSLHDLLASLFGDLKLGRQCRDRRGTRDFFGPVTNGANVAAQRPNPIGFRASVFEYADDPFLPLSITAAIARPRFILHQRQTRVMKDGENKCRTS
jgi:hypothetical protein